MNKHDHDLHGHARSPISVRGGCCCCGCCCCGEPLPHHWSGGYHSRPIGDHESECCEARPATGFHRRFTSRDEVLARFEAYLAELRAEATAVEEHIAEFRKAH